MEEEYIDVRNTQKLYARILESFKNDPAVCDENKTLVCRFLRDAALGKTVIGRAKKKIGPARLFGYIIQLYPLMLYLKKPLEKVTQEDMENFVEALDADQILSRSPRVVGDRTVPSGKLLSPRYKVEIKIVIKKFYKWLLGDSKIYPPLVEWIDTYIEQKEVPSLTQAEVERMIDRSKSPRHRALIQVLFDGGFRIAELLNIRLHHVRFRASETNDPTQDCFFLRVPYSKTLRRTVALPMHASTKWLRMWLEDHPSRPRILPDGTLESSDVMAQLFPMSENAARLVVRRAGKQALGKRVYPHLLRHTSATFWSNKLPYFKFCKRFGWTMTSKMPQRYIDREGVDELDVVRLFHADERKQPKPETQDPFETFAPAEAWRRNGSRL